MTSDAPKVSRREAEVLSALGERLTNAEIAARLFLSERTVESHVSSLLRKFDAPNRLALAEVALRTASGKRPPLPAQLALLSDPENYCGRDAERAQLRALWQSAASGMARVGVVTGEAGIGKSRLVAEVAAEAYADGALVLFGANFEDHEEPFEPFVQAITGDARSLTDQQLIERAGPAAESLARVAPELASRLRVSSDALVFDPVSARTDAYASLHGYFQRIAARHPLVLVVDDAHWATSTTLGALHYIAAVGGNAPVLLLITSRDAAPDLHDALAVFLSDLDRVPSVERVRLTGLDQDEVAELLTMLGAGADPAVTAADTGGNPLFVREVATTADGRTGGSLTSLLTRRNALLDEVAASTLDVASAIGTEFDAELVAAALDVPLTTALESLENAERAGLIVTTPHRSGHFSFVHALFRAARYGTIPAARRLGLHERVAHALQQRGDDDRFVPELARHACIAAPIGDARVALQYATRAAALAEQALAFDEAATHYRRALDVADLVDPPEPHTRLALSIRLGEVMQGGGQPGYEDVLIEAAHTARRLGDSQSLAEVGWAMVKYGGPRHPSRDAEFVAIAQEALRELGPAPTAARARTLAAASEDLCFTDPAQASLLAHEALAIARQLDDPVTLGHVLLSFRVSADTPGNAQARHPTADELIAIGQLTDQATFTMLGLFHRAFSFRGEGAIAAANAAIDDAIALRGERTLPPTYDAALTLFDSTRRALHGDLDGAEQVANEVWSLASDAFSPANWYGPAVLLIRHSQDRIAELLPLIESAVEQPGIGEIYRAAQSVAYAHAGRSDDAAAVLRSFADNGFGAVPRNFGWLASLLAFAETAELVGDIEAAGQLLDLLGPFGGRIADLPQTVIGPVDLAMAQVALTVGAVAMADAAATKAASASRLRGTPIFLGRELVRLAAARARSGAADTEVLRLVSEARDIAARTGAVIIEREAKHYGL